MKDNKENLEFTLYDTLNISDYLNAKNKKQPTPTKKENKITSNQQETKKPQAYNDLKSELDRIKKAKPKEENTIEISKIKKESTQKKITKIEEKKETLEKNKIEPKESTIEKKKVEPKESQKIEESKIEESKPKTKATIEEIYDSIIEEVEEEATKKEKKTKLKEQKEKKKNTKEIQTEKNDEPKENKPKSKKLFKASIITFIVLDILACVGLFLTYGPISYFRNLLITSAMTTMSHKYLARTFYDENTIQKVLDGNHVKETEEETDSSEINFESGKDTGEYESVYEEQILKRDEGNDIYKVIDIKGTSYKGHMVVIYDASRVDLVSANNYGYGGALLTNISKKNNALVAMNASGFYNASAEGKGSVAVGTVIQDGKIITSSGKSGMGGGIAGFNKDHVLVLTKKTAKEAIADGIVDAVEFGPFLIVNGKSSEVAGNGGWGLAPRSVLAQRKDGIVLFLVIDGRGSGGSIGAGMNDLIDILERYKAYNAVNLDGGGSSTLAVENKLINNPSAGERYIPNAWIVK